MSGRRVVSFTKIIVDGSLIRSMPSTAYEQAAIDRGEVLPDGSYYDPDGLGRAPREREIITATLLLSGTTAQNAGLIQSWKDHTIGAVDTLVFDDGSNTYARCMRITARDLTPPDVTATHFVEAVVTFKDLGSTYTLTGGFS